MFEEENIFAKAGLDEMEEKIVEAEKQKVVLEGTGEQGVKTSDVFSPKEKKDAAVGDNQEESSVSADVVLPEAKKDKPVSGSKKPVRKNQENPQPKDEPRAVCLLQFKNVPLSKASLIRMYCGAKGITLTEFLIEVINSKRKEMFDVIDKVKSESSQE